ncbi:hypothetical protein I4U23_028442 [Adineta vaga]|nr:hypothetical protein I4U23_028442 [Adineta vaga]
MRCIAANRSVLTSLDQNATLPDDDYNSNQTATTNDIECMDIIQFADGWYSYPDLNTFNSSLLLDTLTIRNIKLTKAISPWNIKADDPSTLPLTEIATRQLEALFNLSQLLFGLARAEQSNYTFRDLQLGQPAQRFSEAGFNKFPTNTNKPIDFFLIFQLVVNDIVKSGAIDTVFLMYKDPRIRCVKQKCLDLLSNISTIPEVARLILDRYSEFLIQLIQGIRDGHLIEEKIPSLSVLLRLCKVIVDKNLIKSYQYLIDMQLIDIIIDLFDHSEYKYLDSVVYFIKFESLALQCLHIMLQCVEHVDMWSEKAQIRLVNYCCTLLHKSVLDDEQKTRRHYQKRTELNHLIYAEEHSIIHSLSYAILTFLSVVRCRNEIGTFYRENEHFRELLSAMKYKYGSRSEFISRDPSISNALSQVATIMFDRYQRKKRRNHHHHHHHYHDHQQLEEHMKQHLYEQYQDDDDDDDEDYDENRFYRKCSNSLCQITENDQVKFQHCPHCQKLSYCSQYCREVHWTLNHNLSCRSSHPYDEKENSTVLQVTDRFCESLPHVYHANNTVSMSHNSAFETLPVQISQPMIEPTTEITNEICCPSSTTSSATVKKKSFKTFLSLLRVGSKRR